MGAELYNKTNTVKLLPKFNYKGKFRLYPGKSHAIEDYMVNFYKPFEKIGVTIRHTVNKPVIEDEVEKVIERVDVIPEIKKDLNTTNSAESVDIEEVVSTESEKREEALREVIEKEAKEHEKEFETPNTDVVDEPANQIKIYTEEELEGLKISDMKDILNERNVSYAGLPNKRSEYVSLILSTQ